MQLRCGANSAIGSGREDVLMTNLKPDPAFLERLSNAAKRGPTAAERHQQKITFIASSLSKGSTVVTAEQVERELRRMAGAKE